jgi:predicted O-methyltransferase YrrM
MPSGITAMPKIFKMPGVVWGTKGFEFWTLLSLLLLRARPKNILELGSGRSTSVLADYAHSYGGNLTSLETDEGWYNKAVLDITCLGIGRDQVHLIPLRGGAGWYDLDQFRKITKSETAFDFVFIDAPNDARGHSEGYRDDPDGLKEIKACSRECQIMIVDDVHRRHVLETVDEMLSEPDDFEKYYYNYIVPNHSNWLCICVRKSSGIPTAMADIQSAVGANLRRDFTGAMCGEP